MSELISQKVTMIYVNDKHMEQYLSEKIGKRVEIIESANDTSHEFSVTKGSFNPDWDQDKIDDFLETGTIGMEYDYSAIFDWCGDQGWLEEGDYILRVSW